MMKANTNVSAKFAIAIFMLATVFMSFQGKAQTVLNNDRLRVGTGSENSVNTSGNLQQPFYYNGVQALWRTLTYSSYPLDNAYALDGDKTNEWNTNGTIMENPSISGQVIDLSGYVSLGAGKGYGTIKSTGQISIGGKNLEIENTYKLLADKSYIEVKVKVTNVSAALIENVRVWIGTRDDWVGGTDQPTKQKGNLQDGEFVKITNQATRAAALKIISGDEGVLFYTNSEKGNTITQGCCSWSNVIYQNPATSQIEVTNDGSYGFYVRFDDLAPGANDDFTWYYAAGELAELEEIIEDVAEVSGAVSDITYTTATFKATSTLNATGYWMVVPRNSTAPVAAQVKAGANYGSVTVTSHGSGAMVANVEKTFNITGLTAGTEYDLYFVSEDPSPAFSDVLRVPFSSASYTIPVVSSTTAASAITGNGAASGGNISGDGGQPVTARGVCWNTSINPLISNSLTTDGSGTGTFTSSLTGLTHSTTYYIRAYATNTVGTAYGPQVSFTTLAQSVPTLTTTAVASITQTEASSGGTISSDGGLAVTGRGICWSTSTLPLVTGNHTTNGAGTGSFTSLLESLSPGTIYYVRAYAVNSLGTGYGNQLSFTTAKYPQTITFEELPVKTFGDVDFDPGATSSSGLTVTYSSSNAGVATIVAGKIHITGAGSSDITAMQAGNGTYSAAPDLTQVLTVNKAGQAITFNELPAKTYGDVDFEAGATASSSLPVSYSSSNTEVATILGNSIHIVGAGTVTITASQIGNTNYEAAADAEQILTVGKADQAINFAPLPAQTYGNTDFEAEATATSSLTVDYTSSNTEVATVSGSTIHIVGAGYAQITALQSGNTNYNAAADMQQDLNVSKAVLTITADDKDRLYGEVNPVLTMNFAGFVYGDDESLIDELPDIATIADSISGTGIYFLSPENGNDNNYEFAFVNGMLTIAKSVLTVTAEDKNRFYGEENPSFTVSYSGFKNGEDSDSLNILPVASSTANAAIDAGTYLIDMAEGSDNNYSFNCVGGLITVDKKELTATADDKEKTYGDINPGLTISFDGFVNEDDSAVLDEPAVCSTVADDASDAGSYEISISDALDNNYSIQYLPGTLVISKKTLAVTANDNEKTYGDPNPVLSLAFEGFINSESVSVLDELPVAVSEANTESDAGTYPIVVQGGLDNNYSFEDTDGLLTVTKSEIAAKPVDQSKVYGDPMPALNLLYTGMVNDDTNEDIDIPPTVMTDAGESSAVGEYTLTAEGASDNNYTFVYENGLLTVNKKELTVTAAAKSITYGDALPELTWVSEGFALDQDESEFGSPVVITTDASEESIAGTYPITVSGANASNYSISFIDGSLTIGKATLEVFAEDKTRAYKQENPVLTFTCTGFVKGEDTSALEIIPTASTEASEWTPAGQYDIGLSGGDDQNYTFNYHSSLLTIIKADQLIEFEAIADDLRASEIFDLVASASSSLPVEFSISNPEVAVVDGDQLLILLEGDLIITVTQPGDNNWNPATTSQSLAILPSFANSDYLMSPNGDGINDFWHINYLEEYGNVTVRVYNRWGKRVFESSDYSNDWSGTYKGNILPSGAYYFIIDSDNKGIVKGVINIVY